LNERSEVQGLNFVYNYRQIIERVYSYGKERRKVILQDFTTKSFNKAVKYIRITTRFSPYTPQKETRSCLKSGTVVSFSNSNP